MADECETSTAEQRAALGRELRRARLAAGLSQRKLGLRVDRDRSTLSRIEANASTNDAAWWKLADDETDAGGRVLAAWLAGPCDGAWRVAGAGRSVAGGPQRDASGRRGCDTDTHSAEWRADVARR